MSNIQTVFIAAILLGLAGCATVPAKESSAFDCAPKGYEYRLPAQSGNGPRP